MGLAYLFIQSPDVVSQPRQTSTRRLPSDVMPYCATMIRACHELFFSATSWRLEDWILWLADGLCQSWLAIFNCSEKPLHFASVLRSDCTDKVDARLIAS